MLTIIGGCLPFLVTVDVTSVDVVTALSAWNGLQDHPGTFKGQDISKPGVVDGYNTNYQTYIYTNFN